MNGKQELDYSEATFHWRPYLITGALDRTKHRTIARPCSPLVPECRSASYLRLLVPRVSSLLMVSNVDAMS